MKTRNSLVSNSSTSSFIIAPSKTKEEIKLDKIQCEIFKLEAKKRKLEKKIIKQRATEEYQNRVSYETKQAIKLIKKVFKNCKVEFFKHE